LKYIYIPRKFKIRLVPFTLYQRWLWGWGAGEISLNFGDIAHTISNSRQREIPYNGIAFGSLRERFKFWIFLVRQLEVAPRIAPSFYTAQGHQKQV